MHHHAPPCTAMHLAVHIFALRAHSAPRVPLLYAVHARAPHCPVHTAACEWVLRAASHATCCVPCRITLCAAMQALGYGAPEVVTCGRDGCVRVWDVRQHDAPVAAFEPADPAAARDCW